ncbi:MAG: DUF2235 domain-containing protein [Lentilitoribacter sp.]
MAKKIKKGKKIIICCDGTGNEPSATGSSNVFDLVGLLDANAEDLIYYDPGLGTEAAPGAQGWAGKKSSKLMGLAFGKGLSKNIIDAYKFLMDNYIPGDDIYMFGFSRGAYTVRTIAGMLQLIGLLRPGSENLLDFALANYTNKGEKNWANLSAFKGSLCQQISDKSPRYQVPIQFMGVWDTVKSVGLFRNSTRLAYTDILPNVKSLRHALALDERRLKFRPDHFKGEGGEHGAVQAMWFKGVHSDIGGGYDEAERGLSDHAMMWIMEGASAQGLVFNQAKFETTIERRKAKAIKDANDNEVQGLKHYETPHDSLKPYWWIAGSADRVLPDRFWVHKSSVEYFSVKKVELEFDPTVLVKKLGDQETFLDTSVALIKLDGNLLIQKLTTEEQAQLGTLADDPQQAITQILTAGAKSWSAHLEEEFANGSFDIGKTSKKRSRDLLNDAVVSIQDGKIKGEDGAFCAITDFLRMTSLKGDDKEKAARSRIIATAPHLLEALAEASGS